MNSMSRLARVARRVRYGVLPALLLAACESGGPTLPGERIAVLADDRTLTADPALAGQPVRLPGPGAPASWPQQGGNPAHSMGHIPLGDAPETVWDVSIGQAGSAAAPLLSAPVVAEGRVYAMDGQARVSAYQASDGELLWQTATEPEGEPDGSWGGGVAFDGGGLFVSTGFAEVIRLDGATGEEIWRRQVTGPMRAAPTVEGGRVYVVTHDNRTHALDAATGDLLWSHTGIVESANLLGGASPAAIRDTVIAPYSSGEVFALRAETGGPVWSDSLAAVRRVDAVSALADIRGRPVIDSGQVYAVSHSGRMAAIDLRSGRRVWETDIGGEQQPWVAGDYVYLVTSNGEVSALTRADGRVRWVTPLEAFRDPGDRSGRIQWHGPVLAGDRLILTGSHGQAVSVSPYTGEILGRRRLSGGAVGGPVVADGTLYILTGSARLTALR